MKRENTLPIGGMTEIMKQPKRNNSLDGIRFYASALVIASHCGFLAQGGFANNIFFAMSGFFAIAPFKKDAEAAFLSLKKILRYYVERFFRIIPSYWFYLAASFVLVPGMLVVRGYYSTDANLFVNMFFIKVKGHIWFLQQEVAFYIVAPLLMILLALLKKAVKALKAADWASELVCALVLLAASWLYMHFIDYTPHILYGNGNYQAFRISHFMIGMATGYLFRAYSEAGAPLADHRAYRALAAIGIFAFLLFPIVSSAQVLARFNPALAEYYIGWKKPIFCVVITGITTFLISTSGENAANKFLSNPVFSFLGRISFLSYLLHWIILPHYVHENPFIRFLVVYAITVACAAVSHYLVEKPMITLSKKLFAK